jgi:hypothetical protein
MNKSKGFAIVAGMFGVSSASLCLGRQYGVVAGMAGVAFLYAAIAYRMKRTGQ